MAKVFVAGATGKQGGATARVLVADGVIVHALVRDPSSASAQALAAKGVVLFKGDWDDHEAIKTALEGVTGVFLIPMPSFTDAEAEFRCANNIVEAAKKTSTVTSIVLSTVTRTDRITEVEGWDSNPFFKNYWTSKRGVEDAVRKSGVKYWTIIRPPGFMPNYIQPFVSFQAPDLAKEGVWHNAFEPDFKIPLIDPEDIGRVAAAAFREPETWHGRRLEVVGEKVTAGELVAVLAKESGKDLKVAFYTSKEAEELSKTNPVLHGQIQSSSATKLPPKDGEEVLEGVQEPTGYYKFKSLAQWASENKEAIKQTFANASA